MLRSQPIRRGLGAGLLAALLVAATAACGDPGQIPHAAGHTDAPTIHVPAVNDGNLNSWAESTGDGVRTGIVVNGLELVLFLWGSFPSGNPALDTVWYNDATSEFSGWPILSEEFRSRAGNGEIRDTPFIALHQFSFPNDPLVDYGLIRARPARITVEDGGQLFEAWFTSWNHDEEFTLFWVQRPGQPIPDSTPTTDPNRPECTIWAPAEPERYPLVTAYDIAGDVIASARIRPQGGGQCGG